jgi:hypothetical protein
MLKSINKYYFIFSIFFYTYFSLKVSNEYMGIYLLNAAAMLSLSIVLFKFSSENNKHSPLSLYSIVFIYSALWVVTYNGVSYYYDRNFFVFDTSDPLAYDYYSRKMAATSFWDGISYYLTFFGYDDLGAVLIISSLYRLVDSNLIYNGFNLIINLAIARGMYDISLNFMPKKFAFLGALAFTASSFSVWFASSGRKETIMILIIILFFKHSIQFFSHKKIRHLLYMFICVAFLFLFRIPLALLCFISALIGFIMLKNKSFIAIGIFIISLPLVVGIFPFAETSMERYAYRGDIEKLIQYKQSMIKGGVAFTYAINFLSQLIGPLPTISPSVDIKLSCYAPGLIYRVLIATPFFFGIYYILKLRIIGLYPILFFIFLEMISLIFIFEGLELRKSLPHIWGVYIVAFWFLYKCNELQSFNGSVGIKRLYTCSMIIIFVFIFLWNFRASIL